MLEVMSMDRGSPADSRRPRFPALDPEPPPSALWRRRAIRAAVTVVAFGLVAALAQVTVLRNHGKPSREAVAARELSAAPQATILSITSGGFLELSDLREGHPRPLRSLGQFQRGSLAADGRYLAGPNGEMISLNASGGPVVVANKLNFNQGNNMNFAPYDPFADHDQYAVALISTYGYATQTNSIRVQALATGNTLELGTGDNVAGDPQQAGVFTSVATAIRPSAEATQIFPDGRVDLRDAGRHWLLLATARQLTDDLHLAASIQVALFPYPDPSGDEVAIAVQPTSPVALSGVVIMTRTGHLVAAIGGLAGPVSPVCSASGKSLAFAAGGAQPALHIWAGGSRTEIMKLPVSGDYSSCLWSPDGAWILCADASSQSTGRDWILAAASGATMVHTGGPGLPIAWLGEH